MTAERDVQGAPRGAEDRTRAEEKLEALTRFGGGVAHDLNNILQVIKSSGELLRRRLSKTDADTARLLEMVTRNAERGTALGRALLAFSARQVLEPVALNPSRLIADMADRLRQDLGQGATLETALGGGLWPIAADRAELETAITNLAFNARDAMAGRGKVTIETANATLDEALAARHGIAPGQYVTITVRDSGSGMSDEILVSAFDPYFTTKEGAKGLGLSRVYGFIRQSGGQIRVDSVQGAGTTVTLYLPRLTGGEVAPIAARGPDANVLSLSARPASTGRDLAGLRVLVVEDESLIGMMVEDLLEQLGCRMIRLVSSLDKALEAAKQGDFDLALLDVDLGGEPSYPVAQALQARGVPFVFMSGHGALEAAWRNRPIIQKPFDLAQFRREIERVLPA